MLLLAAGASLALAAPALAQEHGGGGPHGGGGGGGGGGVPHGGGGVPHGGGGAPHGGGGAPAHGGAPHGPVGPGLGRGGPPAPGGVFHGYDGVEQRDAHGNAGDRRGFGMEMRSARRFNHGGYQRPQGWYAHRWVHGEILPPLFWAQDYWLLDYWLFGLSPPPYGYVWVRDGSDALLIDRATGEIEEVIYGAFY